MSKTRNYITCWMAVAVISAYGYIFDCKLDSSASARTQSWGEQSEGTANWLADEAYRPVKDVDTLNSVTKISGRQMEGEADLLTFHAADKITTATIANAVKNLSYNEVRLFYYMSWLNKVLLYLTQADGDDPIQSERFATSDHLLELQRLLAVEIQQLESLGIEPLNESVDQISQELFERWKSQVMAMIQDG